MLYCVHFNKNHPSLGKVNLLNLGGIKRKRRGQMSQSHHVLTAMAKCKPNSACRRFRGLYLQLLCSFPAHQHRKQAGLVLSTRVLSIKPFKRNEKYNRASDHNKPSVMALISGGNPKERPAGCRGGPWIAVEGCRLLLGGSGDDAERERIRARDRQIPITAKMAAEEEPARRLAERSSPARSLS